MDGQVSGTGSELLAAKDEEYLRSTYRDFSKQACSGYMEAGKETTSSFSLECMKLRIFSEVTAAAIMGGAFGLHMHGNYVKWNTAGRTAYLTDQAARFDKYFAVPKTAAFEVILITVMAVLVYAIYKGIALAIEKGLFAIQGRRTIQPTPDHLPNAG